MQCNHPNPLGRLIYHTAQELRNVAEKSLNPYDITLEQMHLIKHLSITEGISQRNVGKIVSKTPANTTRILDRLEIKKFITRQSCPQDRRSTLIYLTSKGEKLVKDIEKIFEELTDEIHKDVTDEELAIVRSAFNKIQSNIKNILNKR